MKRSASNRTLIMMGSLRLTHPTRLIFLIAFHITVEFTGAARLYRPASGGMRG
ncbi:MAG: hypothetical protein KGI30_08000 [Planctomycetota bacterium]|nr:hypothetical protein [Planctomycetota bacterium]